MISRRTKMFFGLSAFPLIFVVAAAAWVKVYPSFFTPTDQATYFVAFHLHLPQVLVASASLFLCGFVSLFFDRQRSRAK